jgi:NADPH:quinone reductase-like Zn-dependent oxidoreductase
MKAGDVLPAIEELLAGDSFAPLVDRTFPLGEAADALEYLTTGTTRGKVVLTL